MAITIVRSLRTRLRRLLLTGALLALLPAASHAGVQIHFGSSYAPKHHVYEHYQPRYRSSRHGHRDAYLHRDYAPRGGRHYEHRLLRRGHRGIQRGYRVGPKRYSVQGRHGTTRHSHESRYKKRLHGPELFKKRLHH